MAGRECADIVFCIDASDSMTPCIAAVKENLKQLIDVFEDDQKRVWDLRLDFIAHAFGNGKFHCYSARQDVTLLEDIYHNDNPATQRCFTTSPDKFKNALARVRTLGDEVTLAALDIALDFPWRPAESCHRVVVLLTDEPIETGEAVKLQRELVSKVVEKIHDKRIKLFIYAPESEILYKLSMANGCEYEVLADAHDGMRNVDFEKLMEVVGKSVFISQSTLPGSNEPQPLFGQETWSVTDDGAVGGERFRP
jgi:hypothetical protein